jgi:uncharacterized membrane protein
MHRSLLIIAIAGLLNASYLFAVYAGGGAIPCTTGHGCDVVRQSEYAAFFGLPTPVYGVIFYFLLGVLAVSWLPEMTRGLSIASRLLTLIGLLVSAWLTYLEAFVIQAWCSWCVVSAILALLAFLAVWAPHLFVPKSFGRSV